MLLVVSFNLLGDGLLDLLDPKRRPGRAGRAETRP
jgi:ABC-type dipeptide/oligopeptide/nickel transport system permease subunit